MRVILKQRCKFVQASLELLFFAAKAKFKDYRPEILKGA